MEEAAGGAGRVTLVVILHGLGKAPDHMKGLADLAATTYGDGTVVHVPPLPYSRRFSGVRATRIVSDLLAEIDDLVARTNPERIVLIGHSLGATLARHVFLAAAGCPPNFRPDPALAGQRARPWAGRVERIVLLAAFNRGWKISARMSWIYRILFNIIGLVGHTVWLPTAFDFRLGAPFMVQTRLHWLAFRRAEGADGSRGHQPILVQCLGTQDDLISPFDQVDIAVDGTNRSLVTSGADATSDPAVQDYFLIELPFTNHMQAIDVTGTASAGRRTLIRSVLMEDRLGLKDLALDPTLLADEIDPVDPGVTNTVFVIHGIRDDGFWTHRIAERVRQLGGLAPQDGATAFQSWTPTYGYFAMLPFILPWIRREKVEWFMDQYVTAFAQYPKSDFHYVGHSNGTYLCARALRDYPAFKLKHVLFAGSVVRRDYPWAPLIDAGRVARIQNLRAGGDWVVALLPKSLEWVRRFDLGGGGFDGFHDVGKRREIAEFAYLNGGHGAGIAESHWPKIAEFIVHGTAFQPAPGDPPALFRAKPNQIIAALGWTHLGVLVVGAFLLGVVWGGYCLGGPFGLLVAALLVRFVVLRV